MPVSDIEIKGAREHNLRDIDLVLPRNQLICLTGVSGSGKSSLAFDTLFAEGQRRYIESLSSFARQFLGQLPKPDVDSIAGLSPSISISQKSAGNNPRSTVGTITEIYDYLRILFARVGDGFCPQCQRPITAQTREQIIEQIMAIETGTTLTVLAPIIRGQKGEYRDLFEDLLKQGFVRARVDGVIIRLSDPPRLDRQMRHQIEAVTDRITIKPSVRARLAEAVDAALKTGGGSLVVQIDGPALAAAAIPHEDGDDSNQTPKGSKTRSPRAARRGPRSVEPSAGRDIVFSVDYACTHCGISFDPPSPQLFSFNSPQGMCRECDGLGEAFTFDAELLVPDPGKSFKRGCIEPIGRWSKMGRWRRHIYQGVAETMERVHAYRANTLLDTAWEKLTDEQRAIWLFGTGEQHITYTWRSGSFPQKYGGKFEGIVSQLMSKYRGTKSNIQLLMLEKYMRSMECPICLGQRLNEQARHVRMVSGAKRFAKSAAKSLPEICHMPISDAAEFFSQIELDPTRQWIAREVLKEIRGRLGFLLNVGLDYLTLDRTAPTLSGGESQRIRLAGQVGCGLVGVLYILDEPSIGLHPRDNDRLLATLRQLCDMGNTVVVVEHDEDTMRHADHIIDFGPGPGVRGGEVVAAGTVRDITKQKRSVTGQFLAGKKSIAVPDQRRPAKDRPVLKIVGAAHNNLKQVDVEIPLGLFVCVTGVSGSGKSSLVNDILVEALRRDLNGGKGDPGEFERLEGLEHLDKMIAIDQSPIGRTPRSNPGTYIKVFDDIRRMFTQMPDAKRRGFAPGRFSFNVAGGRCEACEGNGSNKLEMDFLADVWMTCPLCNGHRFNRETLGVKFKGYSIADVLEMDVQQALRLFENIPRIHHKLQTLHDVGLDYLKLGQPSPTLSGGEAQRIKLARELVKKSTGKTLYLLDEPTTGLHFADIKMLLKVLHDFVDAGNTVLVVEHNHDVIKTADWLIDLGPEGGEGGGQVLASGTPEHIARRKSSHTGHALAPALGMARIGAPKRNTQGNIKRGRQTAAKFAQHIVVQGAREHNLKNVSVKVPRDQMTVLCGPSGSGKSSLAMDTIYAEGQRRYVESLSSYARQFVSQVQKPSLEHIEGLSPAIAIEQQNLGNTPRSTVGTTTEIYDYLRILLARLGTPHCPDCDIEIGSQTCDQIIDKVMSLEEGTRVYLMAPASIEVGQKYEGLWDSLRSAGYTRVRIDGVTHALDAPPEIDRRQKHVVEAIVDRAVIGTRSRNRIAESCEAALGLGGGVMHLALADEHRPESQWRTIVHNQHLACEQCGRSFEPLTPHNFSFNSQLGWCPACSGLGTQTGANPAALLRDQQATLAEGTLLLWPDLNQDLALQMLQALSQQMGLPLDVPFHQLSTRARRILFHGTGQKWFDLPPANHRGDHSPPAGPEPNIRFQFKGIYPALEEAARSSATLRYRLNHFVDEVECSVCGGSRLRDDAAAVQFRGMSVDELCRLPLGALQTVVASWKLTPREKRIAAELLREIKNRTQFLNDVGLHYLSLGRTANSLSGGEAQRIRLASQLGSGLCGVLYVLDEPTIGLHARDNARLLAALHRLRDLGNTLLLVEHDREVIAGSDMVMDFGPAAGKHGGEVVAFGTPAQLARRRKSVTGPYLSGKKAIPVPSNRRLVAPPVGSPLPDDQSKSAAKAALGHNGSPPTESQATCWLTIEGARHHNLRNIDVQIPLGRLVAVTGPSGSGKSSLVENIIYPALASRLHRANAIPGAHDRIVGLEQINKVIQVDQQPLGNSPNSNPATYSGAFEYIRELFACLPESKLRGFTSRRFSFNVPGGRCEACEGNGQRCIEMHFLPDVWVPCETCQGKRYNPETLQVEFHGRSIADALELTCGEAVELFRHIPKIRRILQTLCDVGLDYVTLGQSAPTLSGGEAQRVKLAAELARPDTGKTLYLLDEPTTGLHFEDLRKLLNVLQRLVDLGNSVVVIEHNLDIIKSADWVIDMGPEAGDEGGQVVVAGTPEYVAEYAVSVMARDPQAATAPTRMTAIAKGRKLPARLNSKTPVNATSDGPSKRRSKKELVDQGTPSSLPRSYTGEALAPILAAGPYVERVTFDPAVEATLQVKEVAMQEFGRHVSMPWETDGRRWHTQDRVGRRGEPCKWEGKILAEVVDRIHAHGKFSDTDWSNRTIVEIAAEKKSDGWLLHAITGEAWLLKLKFRVAKGTFQKQELLGRFELPTLNELEDLPIYGNESRVRCKSVAGWQEIEFRLHTWLETDTPAFWTFLKQAVEGFRKRADIQALDPNDFTPWKILGEKWHYLPKGFSKPRQWPPELLKQLCATLTAAAPGGEWIWDNKTVVHYRPAGSTEPWVSLHTKKSADVELVVAVPKGRIALGAITDLGKEVYLDGAHSKKDLILLRFAKLADLDRGDLQQFLVEAGGI